MTKLFKSILTIAALCMVSLGAFAQSGVSLPFIAQGINTDGGLIPQGISGYLQFSASSTNSYNSTNTYVIRGYQGYAGLLYTNPFSGVVYSGVTNSPVPVFATNANAIADIDLWADRDGTPPSSLSVNVDVAGVNAAFTNTVTFNFATILGGGLPVSTGDGLVSFSVTGNGTNDVVVKTNLFTSAVLQGVRKVRLLNVASTNAGTNGWLVNCWLDGYKPAGQ